MKRQTVRIKKVRRNSKKREKENKEVRTREWERECVRRRVLRKQGERGNGVGKVFGNNFYIIHFPYSISVNFWYKSQSIAV